MTTIKHYTHRDSSIIVIETTDHDYAHDCFDGTDREWIDVCHEAYMEHPSKPKYYIVSSGLMGCYMADNVSVFGNRTDALRSAKDEYERWQEEDADSEALDTLDAE